MFLRACLNNRWNGLPARSAGQPAQRKGKGHPWLDPRLLSARRIPPSTGLVVRRHRQVACAPQDRFFGEALRFTRIRTVRASTPTLLTLHRFLLLVIMLWPVYAFAHKPSDSYLKIRVEETQIVGQWDIALKDLEYSLGLDANDDGRITWGEVRARESVVNSYALSRLKLWANGAPTTLRVTEHLIDHHTDGAYLVLRLETAVPERVRNVALDYRAFFDRDPQHRGLLQIEKAGVTRVAIFAPDSSGQRFDLETPLTPALTLRRFFAEGVWHIWVGLDHILFLIALLLPSVLRRENGRWNPVNNFHAAGVNVLKVVTAFTLAHSITLTLAALKMVTLPSRLVESAIALSVIVAALNNLRPIIQGRLWLVAFGFGLIHGFGFASVLRDLGLPAGALTVALLGFNLGVETGQLAIVGLFLPLSFLFRGRALYERFALRIGSVGVAVVAAVWLIERVFNVQFLQL